MRPNAIGYRGGTDVWLGGGTLGGVPSAAGLVVGGGEARGAAGGGVPTVSMGGGLSRVSTAGDEISSLAGLPVEASESFWQAASARPASTANTVTGGVFDTLISPSSDPF